MQQDPKGDGSPHHRRVCDTGLRMPSSLGRGCEFSMISIWKDAESIKKAVGQEWQQPILLEDDADLVEAVEMHHFETFGHEHATIY
jgi:hypothetical protein